MSKTIYKNFEELPAVLSVKNVSDLLGVSMPIVYQLAQSEDFHSFKVGNRILITKDNLLEWMQCQEEVA